MIIAEIFTLAIYIASIPFLTDYFGKNIKTHLFNLISCTDLNYIKTTDFFWKTAVITSISLIPHWVTKTLRRKISPPNYAKLQQDFTSIFLSTFFPNISSWASLNKPCFIPPLLLAIKVLH
ncbi:hypothetical protein PCK1_000192 [Pneumocystis canis]|nr:hypothetical protein PCK1_000192 [Pneumocystis canis]